MNQLRDCFSSIYQFFSHSKDHKADSTEFVLKSINLNGNCNSNSKANTTTSTEERYSARRQIEKHVERNSLGGTNT